MLEKGHLYSGETRDHEDKLALFIHKPRNGPGLKGFYYVHFLI